MPLMSCEWAERCQNKAKKKRKRQEQRVAAETGKRRAALINECVHMCCCACDTVPLVLMQWGEHFSSFVSRLLTFSTVHVPTFWSHFENSISFIADLTAAGTGKQSTIIWYYPSAIGLASLYLPMKMAERKNTTFYSSKVSQNAASPGHQSIRRHTHKHNKVSRMNVYFIIQLRETIPTASLLEASFHSTLQPCF